MGRLLQSMGIFAKTRRPSWSPSSAPMVVTVSWQRPATLITSLSSTTWRRNGFRCDVPGTNRNAVRQRSRSRTIQNSQSLTLTFGEKRIGKSFRASFKATRGLNGPFDEKTRFHMYTLVKDWRKMNGKRWKDNKEHSNLRMQNTTPCKLCYKMFLIILPSKRCPNIRHNCN